MRLVDAGDSLLDAVVDALAGAGEQVPERRYVASGLADLVAWDDCCATGGQLTVALSRVYVTSAFPDEIPPPGACQTGSEVVGEWGVEIIGCALGLDDAGNPPDPGALIGEAARMLGLVEAMTCGLLRWVAAQGNEAAFGGVIPLGPDGGCVGYRASVSTVVSLTGP